MQWADYVKAEKKIRQLVIIAQNGNAQRQAVMKVLNQSKPKPVRGLIEGINVDITLAAVGVVQSSN